MDWINYHHLLYFWTVARTGSLQAAADELHLSPPTLSVQIRRLEQALSEDLFVRTGRRLVLTEVGSVVYRFADEIFSLGREMMETLRERPTGRPLRLVVGVADVLPKIVAHRLIEPALRLPEGVRLVCREADPQRLLVALAAQEVDVVLTDTPIGAGMSVRAHSHLLGESGMSFLGVPMLAKACRRGFPDALAKVPMLLPTENMAVRRSLDRWFDAEGLTPRIVGEFEDYALLREFAVRGHGIFPAPSVVEASLRETYRLALVGRTEEVRAQFYVISLEKRLRNPAVLAMMEAAREGLFA